MALNPMESATSATAEQLTAKAATGHLTVLVAITVVALLWVFLGIRKANADNIVHAIPDSNRNAENVREGDERNQFNPGSFSDPRSTGALLKECAGRRMLIAAAAPSAAEPPLKNP